MVSSRLLARQGLGPQKSAAKAPAKNIEEDLAFIKGLLGALMRERDHTSRAFPIEINGKKYTFKEVLEKLSS